ncbi:hydroxyproline dehydrogenase-like, partial [Numenius arquata]|uniref:hydroxyproline dehydrogenase-like n=1 Tax=Numenius arquata TaxID=31919 RepID=UPI003D3083A5
MGRPTAPPALDLEGAGGALRGQSWGALLRALLVLRLCSWAPLVHHAGPILRVSRRVLGERLWGRALRATFYGHFVGGQTHGEVVATARRLRAVGLRPMLALPTEEDVGQEKDGEGWYDANRGAALECVGLAAATGPHPMMQLKVTALMSARLCRILSQRLEEPGNGLTPERLGGIMGGEAAVGQGVRLLLDAETSDLNPGLGLVAAAMMGRHNRGAQPWVWNTYQAYLRDVGQRLAGDAEGARRYGAGFGVKLVRGAYLEAELHRAGAGQGAGLSLNPAPLQPDLQATHRSYGECLELALGLAARDGPRFGLMVATHNEASVLQAVR